MGHQADRSFFDAKRPWSTRKDQILEYYLTPYLAKVARLRRPILVVDGFAGAGSFGDGRDGSPRVIAAKLDEARARGARVRLIAIEADAELHGRLCGALSEWAFAEAWHATLQDSIPRLDHLASKHTTFLYLDPYAYAGLDWNSLDRIFQKLAVGRSIEVLLNFNAPAFCRAARAKLAINELEDGASSVPLGDDATVTDSIDTNTLDSVFGGTDWQDIVRKRQSFHVEVLQVTRAFCDRLRKRFNEVWDVQIKARSSHLVPKYFLIFGSRSEHALSLMNDAIVKSHHTWADHEAPTDEVLFDMRPRELVADRGELAPMIKALAEKPLARRELILRVIRQSFGQFTWSDIRTAIERLLVDGELDSPTGKSRINDGIPVWRRKG